MTFFKRSFAEAFSRAGAFSLRYFAKALSVRSLAATLSQGHFCKALFMRSLVGAFPVRFSPRHVCAVLIRIDFRALFRKGFFRVILGRGIFAGPFLQGLPSCVFCRGFSRA